VDRAGGGAVGYLHVPDTGANGHGRFMTALLRQHPRPAWIVDLRFNQGGHGATVFMEALCATERYRMVGRGGVEARPSVPRPSPAVFLVNEYTGSDGELLAWMVRDAGLGPLIGTRTAGAAVGVRQGHLLADGSRLVFPEYAFAAPTERDLVPAESSCQNARRGHPLCRIENRGVAPDVDIPLTPADDPSHGDPQLSAAIRRALEL
jgi:tricorn protease